jgi:hypothetical protein
MLLVGKGLMGDNWAMEIRHPDEDESAYLLSERKEGTKKPTYTFRILTMELEDGGSPEKYRDWFLPG